MHRLVVILVIIYERQKILAKERKLIMKQADNRGVAWKCSVAFQLKEEVTTLRRVVVAKVDECLQGD